jgi:hypothetical protein
MLLPVATLADDRSIVLAIVIDGKIREFRLSRETAALLTEKLAKALAK